MRVDEVRSRTVRSWAGPLAVVLGLVLTLLLAPGPAAAASSVKQWRQVSVGGGHACGIDLSRHLYCWGANGVGQVGDGTTTQRLRPVRVGGSATWISVGAGPATTCAVRSDHLGYCWGYNADAAVGDGTLKERHLPTRLPVRFGWRSIVPGDSHTCGIDLRERLFCWGRDYSMQLGNVLDEDHLTPALISSWSWRSVVVGQWHSCGITASRRLYCWGMDGRMHGVDNHNPVFASPSRVGTSTFLQVSTFDGTTCAVTTAGTVLCWGLNNSGQVGNGEVSPYTVSVPTRVTGHGTGYRQVAVGGGHVCALTSGGRVRCWGDNSLAQFGNGGLVSSPRPVNAAGGGAGWADLAAGGVSTCGRRFSDHVQCWGDGEYGSNGVGTTDTYRRPVTLGGTYSSAGATR